MLMMLAFQYRMYLFAYFYCQGRNPSLIEPRYSSNSFTPSSQDTFQASAVFWHVSLVKHRVISEPHTIVPDPACQRCEDKMFCKKKLSNFGGLDLVQSGVALRIFTNCLYGA